MALQLQLRSNLLTNVRLRTTVAFVASHVGRSCAAAQSVTMEGVVMLCEQGARTWRRYILQDDLSILTDSRVHTGSVRSLVIQIKLKFPLEISEFIIIYVNYIAVYILIVFLLQTEYFANFKHRVLARCFEALRSSTHRR